MAKGRKRRRGGWIEPEQVTLELTDMAYEGHALAHNGEEVVFVEYGLPGETVTAELFKRQGYQWTQLMDGDVDWPAVMRELRAAGYNDFVISEVDGDRETYAETCRRMDRILGL